MTKAENAGTDLPEFLQDIMAHTFECVARVDEQGSFLSVNSAYAQIYGYTRDEMTGMSWRETVYPEDREIIDQKFTEVLHSGRSEVQIRGIRKNKSVFYKLLLIVENLEPESSSTRHYCFIQDITEHLLDELHVLKSAKASLELQEQQFHDFIEGISGVVFRRDIDNDRSFCYLSDGIEKLLGIPSHCLLESGSKNYAALIHEDDRERVKQILHSAISERQNYVAEYRVQRTDGEYCWLRERGAGKLDEQGKVTWVGGIIRDVTVQKRVEIELDEKKRSIKLLQKITIAANEATSVEHALQVCLDEICAYCDWPVGHAYILNSSGKLLESSGVWHLDSESRYAVFKRLTGETIFDEKTGLPGRMLANKEPAWIEDVSGDDNFPRAASDLPLNITSAFGVPVLVADKVVAVFEFFNPVRLARDDRLLDVVSTIGVQVGRIIERKQVDQILKENEERFSLAIRGNRDGLWDWNLETNQVYFSPRWKSMLGYEEDELEHDISTFQRLIHPDDKGVEEKFLQEARDNFEIEFKMRHKQGHYVDILSRATGLRTTSGGDVVRMVGTHIDITERNRAASRIRESERQLRTLYDDSPAIFFTLDEQGTILSINKYGADLLGFSVNTLIGKSILDITQVDDGRIIKQKLKVCASQPNRVQRCEIRQIHRFGDAIWVRATMRAIGLETNQLSVLVTCEDISEARILSEQLEYQAKHDALTGLINRVEFEKRLRRVLNSETDDVDHALCYLDLDQFKVINDTCGHLAGDELLRRISDILSTVVRKRDTLARMGGDEFAVLLEHCSIEQAKRVAFELRRCIETLRFVWEDKRFTLGISIGLVPMRANSGSLTDILSAADAACYAAKDAGRNRVHVYYSDDIELSRRRGEMEWVSRINHALEEDRFCLEMQTISCLNKVADRRRGKHYELLLRMQGDDGQLIYPGAFLSAAERYNLSEKIDRWVVSTALKWLTDNQQELKALAVCSINLSGHSMGDGEFLDFLLEQFKKRAIPPEKICFEITETIAITNLGTAIQFIHTLKEIGCLFALDDFGTGVSSFNYLKNLPVDFLKIDGSFIQEIHKDPIDHAMVRSINEIGQVMGKETIAEFVENEAILAVLRNIGINYAQGYAIGKPVPIKYSNN